MTNTETQPRLLRVKEAATYLAISERKLWSMTKDNHIQAVKIGRCIRYDVIDLNNFIASSKGAGVSQ